MNQTAEKKPKTITITVNKKPVEMDERRVTGSEIKQAAVAQRVKIQLDFQLALIEPRGEKIIGDNDEVKLTKRSTFVATAADDNSGA